MNLSPIFPCSSFLHNLCSVIKLIEYFAEAFLRLLLLDKTSYAASIYVYTGVFPLFFFFCAFSKLLPIQNYKSV